MLMFKKSIIALLVILMAVGGWTYYSIGEDSDMELEPATAQVLGNGSSENENCAVYVCGAVKNPGVVLLAPSGRIMDAVNQCGGLLPNADAEKINLAQGIKDGMQIVVPNKMELEDNRPATKDSVSSDGRISINTADVDELTKIPGVGKATAQRIIDYRNQNGRFTAIEDLMKIKGIGKAKFEKMVPRVML